MIGMCVSLINFLASGYIVGKFLDKNRAWIIIPTYFIRMAFIIATIFPFFGKHGIRNILYDRFCFTLCTTYSFSY